MARERSPALSKERNELIYQVLKERRTMRIAEFQEYLGVSDMTVRRSLNEMASEGLIKRVHGGAMALDEKDDNTFQIRCSQNREAKIALARKALEFFPENGSVYLDAGSTCLAVAKALVSSGRKCIVITDSILVLQELQGSPTVEAMILGGTLASDKVTVDGALTAETAGKISVDLCLFSANGFDGEQMENQFLTGALTKKIFIERATRSMLIADSSKYDKQSCFRFSGWEDVDLLLTDSGLTPDAAELIRSKGVEVHLVELKQ